MTLLLYIVSDDPDTLLTYLPPTFEDEHPLVATYLEGESISVSASCNCF